MKCGPKTPAGVVSWGARAASVYLGVLVSAIAVREGASGKPNSFSPCLVHRCPSTRSPCFVFLCDLQGPAWAVGNYSICPPVGSFTKNMQQNIAKEEIRNTVYAPYSPESTSKLFLCHFYRRRRRRRHWCQMLEAIARAYFSLLSGPSHDDGDDGGDC